MVTPQRSPGSWQADFLPGHLKNIGIAVFLILISGCATDKFGDNTLADTTAPASLPKGPIALVMSPSATETAQELDAYNRRYTSGLIGSLYIESIRRAYVETSDPELSVAAVTRMLEARLGKVQRFQSFEEASRSGNKLVVELDMQARLINDRSSQPASYLALEYYTADHQYLGTVKSIIRRTLTPVWTGYKREKEIVSDIRQQGEVQAQAIELLRQKLAGVPVEG
ncbi:MULTISPECIES: hypothetical protein [Pseudomonas syringae group]|uniref:Lipoprotein n=1 Tax=Pseudomonas syringae pv. coriandricola TaxID=264453 RepID=A0A0P9NJA1_9PSED|nr:MULTISPECIES: hypothetical protein [Pseudomonas syringae group]KPW71437.1 Uncharacterized protein ALO76_02468 [Pseudomonas syringae pv. coriandricola]RMN08170.1 hypothetical protein ALQ65_03131 [Pseudomonas syringae pv. coriandricola]